ncbi:MAG: hypothetical protein ACI9O6_002435 [Glaciecola sp.]|jgi:hypothetical protein
MQRGSVYGILSAISGFYGLRDANHLLKIHDLKPLKHPDLPVEYLQKICRSSMIEADMHRYTDIDITAPVFDEPILGAMPRSQGLKVCRGCIADGVLHQTDWQRIDAVYCDIHQKMFVNACDHLYVQPEWPDNMQCKACFTPSKTVAPPPMHTYLATLSKEQRTTVVLRLMQLAKRLLRPFDYLRSDIAWTRYDAGSVALLLNDAFLIASNPNSLNIWTSRQHQFRGTLSSIGNDVVTFADSELAKLLFNVEWQSNTKDEDVIAILKKYHSFVSVDATSDKKLYFNGDKKMTPDALAKRVDHEYLYQVLGMTKHETMTLGSFFMRGAIAQHSNFQKEFYDISTVERMVAQHLQRHQVIDNREFVSLFDAPKALMETLHLTRQQINYQLLFGQIDWYYLEQAKGQPIDRVFVSVESILKLSQSYISNTDHVPMKDALNLFSVTRSQLQALIDGEWLSIAPNQQDEAFKVSKHSIRRFFKEHILLNREAALDGVSLDEKINQYSEEYTGQMTVIECGDAGLLAILVKKKVGNGNDVFSYSDLASLHRRRLSRINRKNKAA